MGTQTNFNHVETMKMLKTVNSIDVFATKSGDKIGFGVANKSAQNKIVNGEEIVFQPLIAHREFHKVEFMKMKEECGGIDALIEKMLDVMSFEINKGK
jgi:hypothetical protein